MYNTNQNMIDNLMRQKDRIDEMIKNYQQPQPVNNFINTTQSPQNNLIEWRILNENEEVDNLYVANKTLFINDNLMILKGVDGSLEKWQFKKIYPIDKKDEKINALEDEIRKLKEMVNNEPTKSNEPIGEIKQSNGNVDGNANGKPTTISKSISRQK